MAKYTQNEVSIFDLLRCLSEEEACIDDRPVPTSEMGAASDQSVASSSESDTDTEPSNSKHVDENHNNDTAACKTSSSNKEKKDKATKKKVVDEQPSKQQSSPKSEASSNDEDQAQVGKKVINDKSSEQNSSNSEKTKAIAKETIETPAESIVKTQDNMRRLPIANPIFVLHGCNGKRIEYRDDKYTRKRRMYLVVPKSKRSAPIETAPSGTRYYSSGSEISQRDTPKVRFQEEKTRTKSEASTEIAEEKSDTSKESKERSDTTKGSKEKSDTTKDSKQKSDMTNGPKEAKNGKCQTKKEPPEKQEPKNDKCQAKEELPEEKQDELEKHKDSETKKTSKKQDWKQKCKKDCQSVAASAVSKSAVSEESKSSKPANNKTESDIKSKWETVDDIWSGSCVSALDRPPSETNKPVKSSCKKTTPNVAYERERQDNKHKDSPKKCEPLKQSSSIASSSNKSQNEKKGQKVPGFIAFTACRRGLIERNGSKGSPNTSHLSRRTKDDNPLHPVQSRSDICECHGPHRVQSHSDVCTCHAPHKTVMPSPNSNSKEPSPIFAPNHHLLAQPKNTAQNHKSSPSRSRSTNNHPTGKVKSATSTTSTERLANCFIPSEDRNVRGSRHKVQEKEGSERRIIHQKAGSGSEGTINSYENHSHHSSRMSSSKSASIRSWASDIAQKQEQASEEANRSQRSKPPSILGSSSQHSDESTLGPWDSISQVSPQRAQSQVMETVFENNLNSPYPKKHSSTVTSPSQASHMSNKNSAVLTIGSNYKSPTADSHYSSGKLSNQGNKTWIQSGKGSDFRTKKEKTHTSESEPHISFGKTVDRRFADYNKRSPLSGFQDYPGDRPDSSGFTFLNTSLKKERRPHRRHSGNTSVFTVP